jgi:hypothetical protein
VDTRVVTKQTCSCAVPQPQVEATRKGAARTVCARCGLPIKITFGDLR